MVAADAAVIAAQRTITTVSVIFGIISAPQGFIAAGRVNLYDIRPSRDLIIPRSLFTRLRARQLKNRQMTCRRADNALLRSLICMNLPELNIVERVAFGFSIQHEIHKKLCRNGTCRISDCLIDRATRPIVLDQKSTASRLWIQGDLVAAKGFLIQYQHRWTGKGGGADRNSSHDCEAGPS